MVNPMTDERLAEIKAREHAATEGPWEYLKIPLTRNDLHRERFPDARPVKLFFHWIVTRWVHPQLKGQLPIIALFSGPYHEETHSIMMTDEDGEFMSASRQDIPDLLAEVERLRGIEAELRNALLISEDYRRAYCKGKYELYSLSEEVREAAVKHLPGGSEGPLERYTRKIEREHSPLLVKHNAELVRLLKERDAELAELRKDRERLDWINSDLPLSIIRFRESECTGDMIECGGGPSRKTLRDAIDAAIADSLPASKEPKCD